MSPSNDVAIYAPHAAPLYGERAGQNMAGGAELQTQLIARGLTERGMRVAHIVYPVDVREDGDPHRPLVVQRSEHRSDGRRLGNLSEAGAIWRALERADARVYVARGSGGHLAPIAAFCRARRRKLVFSASNDLDFDFDRSDRGDRVLRLYRFSVETAARLVVQTSQQRELAVAAFPKLDPVLIPSFCQPAEPSPGDGRYFLWVNRMVDYKRPELYLELAAAVPEARFRMVAPITGGTAPELAAAIRARAAELPNVELYDSLPREQLLDQVNSATALVSSSAVEGMPNTFMEAWARAVPVLSLSVDPDGRIAENAAGIVAGGSLEEFAAGARRLWTDAELRSEAGARGRRFVRTTHSAEAVADRWAETLRPLIKRR
jgi:glycosyltransferase involved in cell wall biosynthesis